MSILEQLGFKRRTHVGITISAGGFVELVCIDKTNKAVVKYSSDNIKYNASIREIIDYDELVESLERLFEDVGLDPKECSVTLSMPNVHFGITGLDSTTDTSFIVENIQADIEDLYVFKRNEPAISYSILDSGITRGQKNIVFSAIQTKVVAKFMEIFDKMECDLVRIDTSYASMLRAMKFCDRFNKYVQPEEKTSIILVTPNSCSAFYLGGGIISDITEEPLAVKSFSSEEVYSAVSKMAANSILRNSPETLLIISETDEVDAEILAQRLEFTGEVDCVNKGMNSKVQFIEVYGLGSDIDSNMISYITIEAVGAAAADYDEYPLDINFVPKERIQSNIVAVGGYEVPFDRYLIVVIVAAVLAAVIIALLINAFFGFLTGMEQGNNEKALMDASAIKRKLDSGEQDKLKADVLPIMTTIVSRNKSVVDTFESLSSDIPDSVYIQQFVTETNGGIGIRGEARTSDDVERFVGNLKTKNSSLELTKLSINAQGDSLSSKIPDGYTFEIKTPGKNINFSSNMPLSQKNINSGARPSVRPGRIQPPPMPII